jgi:hypothetical protein
MKFRVEIIDNGGFRPVGDPVEDSDFPTEKEALDWIASNIKYRADENPSVSEYRIIKEGETR